MQEGKQWTKETAVLVIVLWVDSGVFVLLCLCLWFETGVTGAAEVGVLDA